MALLASDEPGPYPYSQPYTEGPAGVIDNDTTIGVSEIDMLHNDVAIVLIDCLNIVERIEAKVQAVCVPASDTVTANEPYREVRTPMGVRIREDVLAKAMDLRRYLRAVNERIAL